MFESRLGFENLFEVYISACCMSNVIVDLGDGWTSIDDLDNTPNTISTVMTGKYSKQTKSVNTAMSTAFNVQLENACCLPLPDNLNLLDDFHFDGASLMRLGAEPEAAEEMLTMAFAEGVSQPPPSKPAPAEGTDPEPRVDSGAERAAAIAATQFEANVDVIKHSIQQGGHNSCELQQELDKLMQERMSGARSSYLLLAK